MHSNSIMYISTIYSRQFSWGVIIGIRACQSSIGPCHESLKFNLKEYEPLESGLFTLKSSRDESDQLSIVYGRQGITVENRSGSGRSSSKYGVEARIQKLLWTMILIIGYWSCSSRCHISKKCNTNKWCEEFGSSMWRNTSTKRHVRRCKSWTRSVLVASVSI